MLKNFKNPSGCIAGIDLKQESSSTENSGETGTGTGSSVGSTASESGGNSGGGLSWSRSWSRDRAERLGGSSAERDRDGGGAAVRC